MTYLEKKNEINANDIQVAILNGDAFCADDCGREWVENISDIVRLTAEDDDFEDWASRLDFSDKMPRAIYVGTYDDGNSACDAAFVLTQDNPYFC